MQCQVTCTWAYSPSWKVFGGTVPEHTERVCQRSNKEVSIHSFINFMNFNSAIHTPACSARLVNPPLTDSKVHAPSGLAALGSSTLYLT